MLCHNDQENISLWSEQSRRVKDLILNSWNLIVLLFSLEFPLIMGTNLLLEGLKKI